MTADAIILLAGSSGVILTAAAHAIVWAFYPEAR